ncbi:MAG TPA: hypothetical protein DEV81_09270 [Cyanobacteria bacterium UBA11049]|nr:hypothetical protein [Cyanobacteria bacterium UBA11049]
MDDLSAPVPDSDHYLGKAMVNYLTIDKKNAYFDFMIQLQPGDDPKLVEDPTIPWDETVSPYIKVATIEIPTQEFDTPERKQFDQSLSFTPWHTLPEHEPLGSVNEARLKFRPLQKTAASTTIWQLQNLNPISLVRKFSLALLF